jgi:hypothetical protein
MKKKKNEIDPDDITSNENLMALAEGLGLLPEVSALPEPKKKMLNAKELLERDYTREKFYAALKAAVSILREMIPNDALPGDIADTFVEFVRTNLVFELDNIRAHGHRGDYKDQDPDEGIVRSVMSCPSCHSRILYFIGYLSCKGGFVPNPVGK